MTTFCRIVLQFLKFTQNLKHFERKPERHPLSVSQISDSERRDYLND